MLRAKLKHLEEWNEARRSHAGLYNQLLLGTVVPPVECPDARHVYHLYVIRAPERDTLQAHLKERGIFTGIHYPVPIHLQKSMAFLGYREGDLPITERLVKEILSLPMFAELMDGDISYVAEEVKAFYQSAPKVVA